MRSPKEIDEITTAIRTALYACPDERLCQIIVNATGVYDPFYVEDDKLVEDLRAYGMDRAEGEGRR